MAVTCTGIREGLAANLSTLDIQVSAYSLSNPTPPCVHIYPGPITYDITAQRGYDKWVFTVQAFVGFTGDIAAQQRFDPMLAPSGATSIKHLLESDPYLGGLVEDVSVVSSTGYRTYVTETGACLGADFTVEVLARGG